MLEELYLGKNRLKEVPTMFQSFKQLKIVGLDWFLYLAPPLDLPKIVEDPKVIKVLKAYSKKLRVDKKVWHEFSHLREGF